MKKNSWDIQDVHRVANVVAVIMFALWLQSCGSSRSMRQKNKLVDTKATAKTHYLFNRIKEIPKKGYAFGHQDATAYGINWKNDGDTYQSDVQQVSGDFPGVYGFEIGHIELGNQHNLDTVNFEVMRNLIRKAHKDKGIITISWHPNNPMSGKSSWDTTSTVKQILKGGVLYDSYKEYLAKVALFLKKLDGFWQSDIPVVFRPFHEMNGDWFWWGSSSCSPEEYKKLWRETVAILSNELKVHNILYMYSPNLLKKEEEFLRYYPGDDYVDLLGVDVYQYTTDVEYMEILKRNLEVLKAIAVKKNMPYALSEAGHEKLDSSENWWTEILDKSISNTGISWALFWRNARESHFYVPFQGQKTSENFKAYRKLPHVLFLEEISNIK
ncbi:mannan endo-1,4-beta-mannosidase [Aquimarina spongiae]|uniref:Mannan endo-1,4-beta-mannosidase n=2 Tax=Aquimarina spongiae TaxID=570521 RepID=A0A1M6L1K2_9FLAO|nr:mannan endo-1,4-beta-mannosidase [Aquimarina spongiae]